MTKVIHGAELISLFISSQVAIKIIDKSQLNPTSLQKVSSSKHVAYFIFVAFSHDCWSRIRVIQQIFGFSVSERHGV